MFRLQMLKRRLMAKARNQPAVAAAFSTKASPPPRMQHQTALVALLSLSVGFAAGQSFQSPQQQTPTVLPNGLPRTCCDEPDKRNKLTDAQRALPHKLRRIVGEENVLEGSSTRTFVKGARLGQGSALAVVTPHHLHDVVEVVKAIVAADCVVLPQGQNTGLTGGSVPRDEVTRPTVVLSLKHLNRIFPLDDGHRVVCLAGVGLASLQEFLQAYFPDRESHSVLGSTFLNPTTAAGVALGSGGTQCRKGPAYTERALYLKVKTNKWKERIVEVVNTLDIEGMEDDELPAGRGRKVMDSIAYKIDTWSRWIHDGYERDMRYSSTKDKKASDDKYAERLCDCNDEVSRYNSDTRGPDVVRSEGKVVILATVHDTFPKPTSTKTYWLSFDSLETALAFRRQVCLDNPEDIPMSCEYMDRDSFDVVDRSGRVMGNMIKLVGTTSPTLRKMWNVKLWIESLPFAGAPLWVDSMLHTVNPIWPAILPNNIMKTGRSMDHHISMTVGDYGNGSMDRILERMEKFKSQHESMVVHECTPKQVPSLSAFRFVAAPAFRTWCVGNGVQGFSVDYALPKNGGTAPPLETASPVKRMRYSHFGCNVVHEDLAFDQGVDIDEIKYALKKTVEHECGGKLPAEHGHGTEYQAPPATQERWKGMDPLNVMNPGVGKTSIKPRYE